MVAKTAVVNDMIEFDHGIVGRAQLSPLLSRVTIRGKRGHEIAMGLSPAKRRRTAVGKIVKTSRCFAIRCRNGNVVDGEIGPCHEICVDCSRSCGLPDAREESIVVMWGRMAVREVSELLLPRSRR